MDFYQKMDNFIGELIADGTTARWENKRAEKKLKKAIRKAEKKIREARDVLGKPRSVRAV